MYIYEKFIFNLFEFFLGSLFILCPTIEAVEVLEGRPSISAMRLIRGNQQPVPIDYNNIPVNPIREDPVIPDPARQNNPVLGINSIPNPAGQNNPVLGTQNVPRGVPGPAGGNNAALGIQDSGIHAPGLSDQNLAGPSNESAIKRSRELDQGILSLVKKQRKNDDSDQSEDSSDD